VLVLFECAFAGGDIFLYRRGVNILRSGWLCTTWQVEAGSGRGVGVLSFFIYYHSAAKHAQNLVPCLFLWSFRLRALESNSVNTLIIVKIRSILDVVTLRRLK
jgi:hypothetical protein